MNIANKHLRILTTNKLANGFNLEIPPWQFESSHVLGQKQKIFETKLPTKELYLRVWVQAAYKKRTTPSPTNNEFRQWWMKQINKHWHMGKLPIRLCIMPKCIVAPELNGFTWFNHHMQSKGKNKRKTVSDLGSCAADQDPCVVIYKKMYIISH
jgi:hypothetical protein